MKASCELQSAKRRQRSRNVNAMDQAIPQTSIGEASRRDSRKIAQDRVPAGDAVLGKRIIKPQKPRSGGAKGTQGNSAPATENPRKCKMKCETGAKRPSGMALKLPAVVEKHGLEALT